MIHGQQPSPYSQFSLNLCSDRPPRTLVESDSRARSVPGGTRWRTGGEVKDWRMEWLASTITPPPNVVYPTLFKLMRTPRLLAVDWTDVPTALNGLVRFRERRNLVSAHVPSPSARALTPWRNVPLGSGCCRRM